VVEAHAFFGRERLSFQSRQLADCLSSPVALPCLADTIETADDPRTVAT
jgi:hypothetical protein